MNDEQTIDILNLLISKCRNTQKIYQHYASDSPSYEWKSILLESAEQRRVFSMELTNLVVSLGGIPDEEGSDYSAMLSAHFLPSTLLMDLCTDQEDETRQAYEDALSQHFSRMKRSTLKRQYRSVLITQAQFNRLRNRAVAYH